MATLSIDGVDFNSEVRFDLQGLLEAVMATEASKLVVRGNMHMDIRVIEVTDEVKFEI